MHRKVTVLSTLLVVLCALFIFSLPAEAKNTGLVYSCDARLYALGSNQITIIAPDKTIYTLDAPELKTEGAYAAEPGCTVRISSSIHHGKIEVLSMQVILPSWTTRRAAALLQTMSLREKISQMMFIRCPADNDAATIAALQPGGVLLFAANTQNESPFSLSAKIAAMQEAATIPLLVGVDEEGGIVCRISSYQQYRTERFASPQRLYQQGGMELIAADSVEKSQLLLSLGINVNFAPVADVSNSTNDFIYSRSFGQDAAATADYIRCVVSNMEQEGIGAVLKHFPGYGNNADTHIGIVTDPRPVSTFYSSDLLPFQAGIEAGADFVLVSHNLVTAFDSSYPASLSPAIHELLRDELGFSGLIITDDLSMGGITDLYSPSESAVLAVAAGNDLLLSSNPALQIEAILSAVENGQLNEDLIDLAVGRILRYKIEQGWL